MKNKQTVESLIDDNSDSDYEALCSVSSINDSDSTVSDDNLTNLNPIVDESISDDSTNSSNSLEGLNIPDNISEIETISDKQDDTESISDCETETDNVTDKKTDNYIDINIGNKTSNIDNNNVITLENINNNIIIDRNENISVNETIIQSSIPLPFTGALFVNRNNKSSGAINYKDFKLLIDNDKPFSGYINNGINNNDGNDINNLPTIQSMNLNKTSNNYDEPFTLPSSNSNNDITVDISNTKSRKKHRPINNYSNSLQNGTVDTMTPISINEDTEVIVIDDNIVTIDLVDLDKSIKSNNTDTSPFFLPNVSLITLVNRIKSNENNPYNNTNSVSKSTQFIPKLKNKIDSTEVNIQSLEEKKQPQYVNKHENITDTNQSSELEILDNNVSDLCHMDSNIKHLNQENIIAIKSTSLPPKFKSYDPIPLRNLQTNSSSNINDNNYCKNNNLFNNKDRDSIDHWRDRIWPTKAIYSFARVITRCIPQINLPTSGYFNKHNVLTSHWRESQLRKIDASFDSISALTSSFFMLLAEECRQSVCQDVSNDELSYTATNEDSQRNISSKSIYWSKAEIECVLSESEKGSLPQYACDNRLSSVWNVKVMLLSNKQSSYYDAEFSSGDLIYITSNSWERPLLGVVQGWDPDEISLNGYLNISTRKRSNSALSADSSEQPQKIDNINILICVTDSDHDISRESIGGWATPGMIINGLSISLTILGNTLTFIRESQALVSLRYISPKLQDIIIRNNKLCSSSPNELISENIKTDESINPLMWTKLNTLYNDTQLLAIKKVIYYRNLSDPNILLLQGPPGTGKTHTILGIIGALLTGNTLDKTGKKVIINNSKKILSNNSYNNISDLSIKKPRILLCAPSNTAVDELVYRLYKQGVIGLDGDKLNDLSIIRVGFINKKKDFLTSIRYSNSSNQEMKSVINEVIEKLSLETLVENKRKYLNSLESKVSWTLSDIRKSILDRADIVCCTLSGAGSQALIEVVIGKTGFKFDAIIIDEAAQSTEPSALIPFKFDPHLVIMVGDPCQLPAVILSKKSKECNYHQSLFERLQKSGVEMTMLNTQYRMHPYIADYSSYRFYNNQLITDSSLLEKPERVRPYYFHPSEKFKPFVFHNVMKGYQTIENTSYKNIPEALYIAEMYQELKRFYPHCLDNIGIIAPYSAQRKLLKQIFKERFGYKCNVEISTIDGFQGREKDIIFFSCVRAPNKSYRNEKNMDNSIGFLKEKQRLNVAITRARNALWIVGHADTLSGDSEWEQLLNYMKTRKYIYRVFKEYNDKKSHNNNTSSKTS